MEENQKNKNPETNGSAPLTASELEKCKKERDEYLAGWQRAKADFVNYKKGEHARLQDIARYGNMELMMEFIAILDNFDLGLRALEKSGPVERGVYMIRAQMEDILKRHGVERINVKPGDKFDPSVSEAIAEVASELPDGAIVEEIEPGYRLYDKIVRPARVKIAKSKEQGAKSQ